MIATEWIAQGTHWQTAEGALFYRDVGTGPWVLLLHGFPTWSWDWVEVVPALSQHLRVVALDFLGYGASDKPAGQAYRVALSADHVEQLVQHLGADRCHVVAHDYGTIVAQELVDRQERGTLSFRIERLALLNASLFAGAYRPTLVQRALLTPGLGAFTAQCLRPGMVRRAIDRARGRPLTDDDFAQLRVGMERDRGVQQAHRLLSYVAERRVHGPRWEAALASFPGPVLLLWGLLDPVSGDGALALARAQLPHAEVVTFDDVGHFVPSEAPARVARALLPFLVGPSG